MRHLEMRHGSSTVSLELPDSWEVMADFQILGGRQISYTEIHDLLKAPIGTPPLREMVRPGQKVCIIVHDETRPVPIQVTVRVLLDTLRSAGIADKDVTVISGCGTHRRPTTEEIERIVGSSVVERVRCLAHNYRDKANLVFVGTTPFGTPVWVNRVVAEADLVIGVGIIVPHFLTGFSGGAKILLPGVSGLETIAHNHFEVAKRQVSPPFGNVTDNVVREDMEAAAKLAGLRFIVNFIPDQEGQAIHVVAGDPVAAHRRGVELALKEYTLRVDSPVDVVISSAAPIDIDLNQSAKARTIGALALKDEGSLLWLGACEEGVGFHGLMEDTKQPTLLHDGTKREVHFYSKWLSKSDLEGTYQDSVKWGADLAQIIEEIRGHQGDRARVIILRAAPLSFVTTTKGS